LIDNTTQGNIPTGTQIVIIGGGTCNPIAHLSPGIKAKGENRTQYGPAVDQGLTILNVQVFEPHGQAQPPIDGLSWGYENEEAVSQEYHAPFNFTGKIHKMMVEFSGELLEDGKSTVARLPAQR
jgi:hypothetical protein